jgi:hypothetical protein
LKLSAPSAQLAVDALLAAIREYSDAIRDSWEGDQALICTVSEFRKKTIEREIQANGLRTVAEVTRAVMRAPVAAHATL